MKITSRALLDEIVARCIAIRESKPGHQPSNNPDPACRSCWDKGYASYYQVTSWGTDFPGDRPGRRAEIVKKFCGECWKGRRMELDDAFERGRLQGMQDQREAVREVAAADARALDEIRRGSIDNDSMLQ